MIKDFLLRQMIKSQLKNVPEAEQEKLIALIEKNPELFMKIGREVKIKMDAGKDQMNAMMEVMKEHEIELKGIL